MDNKIIGRFEPIGDDKGPKRSAFNVLTKESYGWGSMTGWQGLRADSLGSHYSIIGEHWRWVPALPEARLFNPDAEVDALADVIGHREDGLSVIQARAVLDAGYRKFEIIEGPEELKPDGGSAFCAISSGGLTVRDSFAQTALQGILANPETRKEQVYRAAADQVELHTSMARTAYALADAMLAERAK